jgi:ankyrin repeat protein
MVIFNLFYKIKIILYLLFIAARNGHDEIVKELLNRNAIIEAKDVDEWTPLIWGLFSWSFFNFTQSICDCL